MRIKLDKKHILCSDKYCCWLVKTVEGENGPYELRVSGYHWDLNSLVEKHIDGKVMGSDAETLQALAKDLADIKNEVRTWKKAVKK